MNRLFIQLIDWSRIRRPYAAVRTRAPSTSNHEASGPVSSSLWESPAVDRIWTVRRTRPRTWRPTRTRRADGQARRARPRQSSARGGFDDPEQTAPVPLGRTAASSPRAAGGVGQSPLAARLCRYNHTVVMGPSLRSSGRERSFSASGVKFSIAVSFPTATPTSRQIRPPQWDRSTGVHRPRLATRSSL